IVTSSPKRRKATLPGKQGESRPRPAKLTHTTSRRALFYEGPSRGYTATLSNLSFANCSSFGPGGAIELSGSNTLNLTNCTLSTNTSEAGGAIFASGQLNLNNCTLSGNSADSLGSGGGAIYCSGQVTLANCTLSGNHADGSSGGGAITLGGAASLTMSNSTL